MNLSFHLPTDTFQPHNKFIWDTVPIFKILKERRVINCELSFRDYFFIETNKSIPTNKCTTKVLRRIFAYMGKDPTVEQNFVQLKLVRHPKEREIDFFRLHNVLLTNVKLHKIDSE